MAILGLLLSVIAVGALIDVTAARGVLPCPYGWKRIGDKCYVHLGGIDDDYDDAKDRCESYDASLIVPRSEDVVDLLVNTMFESQTNMWIGCDDIAEEGNFVCLDGLPPPTEYFPYHHNEPNNGVKECKPGNPGRDQNCLVLALNERLFDIKCGAEKGVICEKRIAK